MGEGEVDGLHEGSSRGVGEQDVRGVAGQGKRSTGRRCGSQADGLTIDLEILAEGCLHIDAYGWRADGSSDGGGPAGVRCGEPRWRGDNQVRGSSSDRVESRRAEICVGSDDHRAGDDGAYGGSGAGHGNVDSQAGTNILKGLERKRGGVQ